MRRWLFLAALAAAGCQSETMERDAMGLWRPAEEPEEPRAAESVAEQRPEPPKGTVVSIPGDVVAAETDFVERPATLFGDVVEADLSRNGWLARASFAIAKDAVIRRDEEDPARGVLTITLQRIPDVPATKDSVPTVRFGGGLRIVGVDRVVLRFWTKQSAERPHWMNAVAAGRAVYAIEGDAPKEWRGSRVELRSEIHKAAGGYRFDSSAESTP